jgi:hypothetical protein
LTLESNWVAPSGQVNDLTPTDAPTTGCVCLYFLRRAPDEAPRARS